MPGVGRHERGRGVVAGDHEHVRAQAGEARDVRVELFEGVHLGEEVAVLTGGVGLLVVDEEVVELVPALAGDGQLLLHAAGAGEGAHAGQLRETAVHGVDGEGGGAQAPHILDLGQGGVGRETAQGESVRRFFVREEAAGLGHELVDEGGGTLAGAAGASGGEGRDTLTLRVGRGDVLAEAGGAQDKHEAVLAHGLDEELGAIELDAAQALDERRRALAGDASRRDGR